MEYQSKCPQCDGLYCAERIAIFHHLDQESLRKISALARHCHYPKGCTLISPTQPAHAIYFVARGRLKLYQLSTSGKEQLLRILQTGDVVGEERVFATSTSCLWCEAMTDVEVCQIDRSQFTELLLHYPSISLKILATYAERIETLEEELLQVATEPVKARVLHYLKRLQQEQGSDAILLPLSYKEIATFLSTSPETLSRVLKKLEEEKTIQRKLKRILFL